MRLLYFNIALLVLILSASCSQNSISRREKDIENQVTEFSIAKSPLTTIMAVSDTVNLPDISESPYSPIDYLSFKLSKDTDIRIEVYDILGKLRLTWENPDLSAGSYMANFKNVELDPGLYKARLIANGDIIRTTDLMF